MSDNIKFAQGNEVCAEAALYAGLDFFTVRELFDPAEKEAFRY